MKYFDYGLTDFVPCEACGSHAVDVHHINGRNIPDANNIKNLMALCRTCHNRAHGSIHPVSKSEFQLMHNYFLQGIRKSFLK